MILMPARNLKHLSDRPSMSKSDHGSEHSVQAAMRLADALGGRVWTEQYYLGSLSFELAFPDTSSCYLRLYNIISVSWKMVCWKTSRQKQPLIMCPVDDLLRGHQRCTTARQVFGHLSTYISPEIPASFSGEGTGCAVTCMYYCNLLGTKAGRKKLR